MNRTILFVLLVGASGCFWGRAELIRQHQTGGEIRLVGNDRNKGMQDAHQKMAAHCGPGNYSIVSQGEVVIGQDTFRRQDSEGEAHAHQGSAYGRGSEQEVTSTRNATEWQVKYQCGGGQAPAPQPAGPTEPPPPAPGQPY